MHDSKNLVIKGVECRLNQNGNVELKLDHVAKGLGFTFVAKSGNDVIRWNRVNQYLKEFGFHICVENSFIPENIFYKLCFKANNEIARKFQDVVTNEILPSIRRTGGYMVAKPDETPEEIMARALLVANDTITRQKERADVAEKKALLLESQNSRQAEMLESVRAEKKRMLPKVVFATAVETSDKSVLVGELATIIKQNGVEIGQNRLFDYLRKNGYLCSKGERYNLPTQRSLDMELFEVKKTTITKPDGTTLVTTTPKVTGKGQIYFVNRFLYDSINQAEIEKQKKGGYK